MRRARKKLLHRLVLSSIFACSIGPVAIAADQGADPKKSAPGQGAWVTSIAPLAGSDGFAVSISEGLLLRPGKIAVAPAVQELPAELFPTETSVWSVTTVDDAGLIAATDYKGGLWTVGLPGSGGNLEATRHDLGLRWSRAIAAAPEKQLVVSTEDGKLAVVQLPEAKVVRQIDAHGSAIFDIAFSPTKDRVATSAGDGSVKIWSWPELSELANIATGSEAIWTAKFSSDGRYLVVGGADRKVSLIDSTTSKKIMTLRNVPDWVTSLDSLPSDGGQEELIAAGCMNGQVILFDLSSRRQVARLDGPGSAIWDLKFSNDGSQIILGTRKHGLASIPSSQWSESLSAVRNMAITEVPPAPPID